VFCHFAPHASRRMENAGKEAGGPAATSANVEAVGGSSNGNGHGFVPLVTVVGFHHARCAILDPESMGRQLIGS
jgi:hypothetical protein